MDFALFIYFKDLYFYFKYGKMYDEILCTEVNYL